MGGKSLMKVPKHSFAVYEGDEHKMVINGSESIQNYSFVYFYIQENNYRHTKTFDTFKEAYDFLLKIFFSADVKGIVSLNREHWKYFENEIAC